MVVIYAEKYSLAKTIAAALGAGQRIPHPKEPSIAHWEFSLDGKDAVLCHGVGHLAALADAPAYGEQYNKWDYAAYPCIPDKLRIVAKENTKTVLNYVADFFRKADWIINATDPDREGELIFAYICNVVFGNRMEKTWKRVILSDMTDEVIRKAFKNLKDGSEMTALQLAGKARSAADWYIGINLTMAASKQFGGFKKVMPVGRVQTPTLALVVEREKVVKSHKKVPFWRVCGKYNNINIEYSGGQLNYKSEAENIKLACDGKQGVVTQKTVKKASSAAPLLYNTTSLLAAASSKFGWSLEEATKILQKLYENKLLSYPRTSSEHLTVEMQTDVTSTISSLMKLDEFKQFALPQKSWNEYSKHHFDNSKVDSHTAIVPTTSVPTNLSGLTKDEKSMYLLAAKSLLRIVYPKSEIEKNEIEIAVGDYKFLHKSNAIKNLGWKVFDEETAKKNTAEIAEINEGSTADVKLDIVEGTTEPPKRYTEASLALTMEAAGKNLNDKEAVKLMKERKMGLGTGATRAAIIKALFDKELIAHKLKSIIPTEKGVYLIEHLPIEELKSAEITGEWERRLYEIEMGGENAPVLYHKFITEIKKQTAQWFETIHRTEGAQFFSSSEKILVCPFCKKQMFKGKFGYSCTGYKEGCNFQISYEICGKTITEAEVAMLCSSGKTAIIKGFVSKKNKSFDAALALDKANKKITFQFENRL